MGTPSIDITMNLKALALKKAYSSDSDDFLYDFYIPALQASVEYRRLAGFFSSKSLAIAARGILGLIKNEGTMKLIISPIISKTDLNTILKFENHEKYIENKMLEELDKLEDDFVRDHVFALGWMIANKRLEIKVAVAYNNNGEPLGSEDVQRSGLFHQKVGILKDSDGNTISFSGSVNETAMGWLGNVEEFKVFRSWHFSEEEYVNADISKFNRFWNNQSQKVKVMDVPYAVKEKLIRIAPTDIEKINLDKWNKTTSKKIKLFSHQEKAIESWIKNDKKGIFEMATGTGKTFTALGCLDKISESSLGLLVVITCPYQHLVQQWRREIDKFGIKHDKLIIADSPSWRNTLTNSMIDISLGYEKLVIIIAAHPTFSSDDFIKIIKYNKNGINIFLIADEVHSIGAEKRSRGLIDEYNFRLGLSATPKRAFDTFGTMLLYNYFGEVVFEFGLEKAINTINPATGSTYLTPYRYVPKFVSLTIEELEEYVSKTRAIAMKFNNAKSKEEKENFLETLLFARADIIKNAVEKYSVLEEIFDDINSSLKWALIYCSPQQMNNVMEIINKRGFLAHRFTMAEDSNPSKRYNGISERDFILQKFGEGKYQVLVAMKCLDEGVDVPPAKIAILMSSSTNPREYIQRIGRIIRRYPGKNEASIYDIVVVPSLDSIPPELFEIENKIFDKELMRCENIGQYAINNADVLKLIYDVKNRLRGV